MPLKVSVGSLRQDHEVVPDRDAGRRIADVLDGVGDRHRLAREDAVGRRGDRRDDQVGERLLDHVDRGGGDRGIVGRVRAFVDRAVGVGHHDDRVGPGRPRERHRLNDVDRRARGERPLLGEIAEQDGVAQLAVGRGEDLIVPAVGDVGVALVGVGPGDLDGLVGRAGRWVDDVAHDQVGIGGERRGFGQGRRLVRSRPGWSRRCCSNRP